MRLTLALRNPAAAREAIDALADSTERAALEGLAEAVFAPPSAEACQAALAALAVREGSLVEDAFAAALESETNNVRVSALYLLEQRGSTSHRVRIREMLRTDGAWRVRRASLRILARDGEDDWPILDACDDPHWRVRHALVEHLLEWADSTPKRELVLVKIGERSSHSRARGLVAYLRVRWHFDDEPPELTADNPAERFAFWDWDTAVLARNLEELRADEFANVEMGLPYLLDYNDDRVRGLALKWLRKRSTCAALVEVVRRLEEPRTGCVNWVHDLLAGIDEDRLEELARHLLHREDVGEAGLIWAIRQVGEVFPLEEEHDRILELCERWDRLSPGVQIALAPFRGSAVTEEVDLEAMAQDADFRIRRECAERLTESGERPDLLDELARDDNPLVRGSAMTPERARLLVDEPERETSWHVLDCACRLARTPAWKIHPEPWQPPTLVREEEAELTPSCQCHPNSVMLGNTGLRVSRMGVSGHYGLPVEGFVRAMDQGVNLMFWEPNYSTMSAFVRQLSSAGRRELHLICGSFEADGKRVRRDAERALRQMRIERIDLFLLFWVQDHRRLTPDVLDTLEALRNEGKIGAFSLSTHNRAFAVEMIEGKWNPLMVRHSAAHRGAESKIFPVAREHGTSLITFNNTCYGRLLDELPNGLTPADCYRYTLATEGVSVCLSAPSTLEQLDENLRALHEPDLSQGKREALRQCGDAVYREDTVFRKCVRSL